VKSKDVEREVQGQNTRHRCISNFPPNHLPAQ
jgi:hypothetical protein